MENLILEYLVGGGSTAAVVILALVIFLMYRKDRKSSSEQQRSDRIFAEDRLTKIIENGQKATEENTKATTELTTYLKIKNGGR